jgi:hypothetical protein
MGKGFMSALLGERLHVVNVGLSSFADSIREAGGSVMDVDWRPPAEGDAETGRRLARLMNLPAVEEANRKAFQAYLDAQPVLDEVRPARESIPDLNDRLILHAGPPIAWERMCGPMQGAVVGAIMFEGWAQTPDRARSLAA